MAVRLGHPLPGARLTAGFGWRPAFTENGRYIPAMLHNGADYGAPSGTLIRAAHPGRVTYVGWDTAGGGWMVKISAARFETLYLHMREKSTHVRVGQWVKTGQVLGRVGMSGTATGPHLHFMLRLNGMDVNPVPYIIATPKPTPKPTPRQEEEDDMTTPIYARDKATNGKGSIYLITANGRKRKIPSAEWNARRAAHDAAGEPAAIAEISAADLKKIPTA